MIIITIEGLLGQYNFNSATVTAIANTKSAIASLNINHQCRPKYIIPW